MHTYNRLFFISMFLPITSIACICRSGAEEENYVSSDIVAVVSLKKSFHLSFDEEKYSIKYLSIIKGKSDVNEAYQDKSTCSAEIDPEGKYLIFLDKSNRSYINGCSLIKLNDSDYKKSSKFEKILEFHEYYTKHPSGDDKARYWHHLRDEDNFAVHFEKQPEYINQSTLVIWRMDDLISQSLAPHEGSHKSSARRTLIDCDTKMYQVTKVIYYKEPLAKGGAFQVMSRRSRNELTDYPINSYLPEHEIMNKFCK